MNQQAAHMRTVESRGAARAVDPPRRAQPDAPARRRRRGRLLLAVAALILGAGLLGGAGLARAAGAAPRAPAGAVQPPPQSAGDDNWDNRFTPVGPAGVDALAVGAGRLYIADGDGHVWQWDSSSWLPIGTVFGVKVLLASGGNLYAGGSFTSASGTPANGVAVWNGTSWGALGSGVSGGAFPTVSALAVNGTLVYAGGSFDTAGGQTVNGLAVWNGNTWAGLGGGVSSAGGNAGVYALAWTGSLLAVAGSFDHAGSVSANNIAAWTGSAWAALGAGMDNSVTALAVSGNTLYAGGYFSHAGSVSANSIAAWTGSAWTALAGGVDNGVSALAAAGSSVYAVPGISSIDPSPVPLEQWNGSSWAALGSAPGDFITVVAASGTAVYAGGTYYPLYGGNFLVQWTGSSWAGLPPVGGGVNGTVRAIANAGTGAAYVGGDFTNAGGVAAAYVAQWSGSAWTALGGGPNGPVRALAVSGGTVYVGGQFSRAGGVSATNIAQWDGHTWAALGSGVGTTGGPDSVSTIVVSGTEVYVGGLFASAGGVSASSVARWNGSTWSALGSGTGGAGAVFALAVSNGKLYAGGRFSQAGGGSANNIAQWDGHTWTPLSSGLSEGGDPTRAYVLALAPSGSTIYAGGLFDQAGGSGAASLARWTGNAWAAVGSGTDGTVEALALSGSNLYVAGRFAHAGGAAASNVALWTGSTWTTFGSGLESGAGALALDGSDLLVGGGFLHAGGKPAAGFAIRHPTPGATATPTVPSGTATPIPFTDVHRSDYFYAAVQYLAAHGAISGYSSSPPCPAGQTPCFHPYANATRGQMVKIIVLAAGLPLVTPATATFSDVPVGSPFFSFVETAAAHQIVGGYADGTFRPAANVTRGQLAKIVVVTAGWPLLNPPTPTFQDVPRGSPFYTDVETAVSRGVVAGYGDHTYRPGNNATRGQIAKIVYLAEAPAAQRR